jgi:hypothetical protein
MTDALAPGTVAEERASINRWLAERHGWVCVRVTRLDDSWDETWVPPEVVERAKRDLMRRNPGSIVVVSPTR